MKHSFKINLLLVTACTVLAFLVMGYHPGLEDDGLYLSAVKSNLNPALYPHDAPFFRMQMQATVFDVAIASFIRFTGIPVDWAELLWQLISIATILFACWKIARWLFKEPRAQWAGVAMVGAMLTLPVAGTALNVADQHLHPRNLATALILLAVWRVLAGKRWQAAALLLAAFFFHPIMAAMGISFCCFLAVALLDPAPAWLASIPGLKPGWRRSLPALAPLGWIFDPPNPIWRSKLVPRPYLQLYRWQWYEWLGAIAPLFLFWLLWRWAQKRGEALLARFALAVFAYGTFHQALAMVMQGIPSLIRLTPLQPMRFLHLIYVFLPLMGGCLIGRYLLKASLWRWAIFLLAINGGMFAAQREMFSASQHLELPGRATANAWLQAFAWIRQNTPTDAYFALGPRYLAATGEDFHGFRALAERSQLADAIKDGAIVFMVPSLGGRWQREVQMQQGWEQFQFDDFERLKVRLGVDWVVVAYPPAAGLDCRWHNGSLAVCKIP